MKAAQVAAFFAAKNGGHIGRMKLIKLMYLADREALIEYGHPISDDDPYSLDNGPILSHSLNLMRNLSSDAAWSSWILANDGCALAKPLTSIEEQLDELSRAELEAMARVWTKFGNWTGQELSSYTHKHCAEWSSPSGSSHSISRESILQAIGIDEQRAKVQSSDIQERRRLSEKLAEVK